MSSQRVAAFDRIGDGSGFVVRHAAVPVPAPDELLFKVAAFGLNQADLLLTQGRHYVEAELPIRLGYEGCGTVIAIGKDVDRFRPGDRITAIPNVDGPYWTGGEFALARQSFVSAWPDGWSAAEAASFWMAYLTPYFPFAELFPFAPGQWVMITAASGGTGMGLIVVAKRLGARVIATTRTASKRAALRAVGADIVLSTDDADFVDQVLRATDGAGVKLICDSLCGPYAAVLSRTLCQGGVMFIHGALGADDNLLSLPVLELVHRQAGVHGYSLINELRHPAALERGRTYVLEGVTSGLLPKPRIDSVFRFNDVPAAYARLGQGGQTGKIVVQA